LIVDAAIID